MQLGTTCMSLVCAHVKFVCVVNPTKISPDKNLTHENVLTQKFPYLW